MQHLVTAMLVDGSVGLVGIVAAILLGAALIFYFFSASSSTKPSSVASAKEAAAGAYKTAGTGAAAQDPAEEAKPRVRLLYGTQTGTAERFSKQLAAELRQGYGDSVHVDVTDLENYAAETSLHTENLVLFLVATYGDGEPTDNAAEFYHWLVQEGQSVDDGDKELSLGQVSYSVFALGNRQYEHFCAVGKKVDKVMQQLGATRIAPRGDGDDDDCIDDDFDRWKTTLMSELKARPELLGARDESGATEHAVASYQVELLPSSSPHVDPPAINGDGTDHHSPCMATLKHVRELHAPQSDRSCVHAEIDVTGSSIQYAAGDHLALLPENAASVVTQAAQLLGQPLDLVMQLSLPDPNPFELSLPWTGPVSLRTALTSFTDLLSSPRKEALLALAAHTSNPDDKMRLEHLASPGGKQEYTEWVIHQQRSLLEVMAAFPSAQPPLGVFFASVAPRLQPRFYSISSSPKEHPKSIHVTCAVVRDKLSSGRLHEGVCSTWLQRLLPGSRLPVFWRHSSFKLPTDPSIPIVMVGPGTGLAPFRGFMQERRALAQQGVRLGEAHLFFGCRNRSHDYIYQQELQDFLSAGAITALHVAFSRELAHKDYVQHHMQREAATLWHLLAGGGAYLYVCGDAKHMARDVHRTLIDLVAQHQGRGTAQAELFVQRLSDVGRYQRDVW